MPWMFRWSGKFPVGLGLGGIKTHMDIYITPVTAAGESDI